MPAASGSPSPRRRRYDFDPCQHEDELAAVLVEVAQLPEMTDKALGKILRCHPRGGCGLFKKSELLAGLRYFLEERPEVVTEPELLARRLRMKPVRTLSGVAVVTVFTRPHPCPGRCIFCPSDVRMPKSYLADEPGAQRAAFHAFDPYRQTIARLLALDRTGHRWDKVELIVLGGTWTSYPEGYRLGFLQQCFQALNDFGPALERRQATLPLAAEGAFDEARPARGRYNEVVRGRLADHTEPAWERATGWDDLAAVQRTNETAAARCVGLVLETRPDFVTEDEVRHLRRLGATKVQLGLQSLSDAVLAANRRGHTVARAREAMNLLRRAGFKLHAHWMPNLLGSTPEADRADFDRLFADPAFRPDELKIYPCSLVESAELMDEWRAGRWRPYERDELLAVLTHALTATPPWCRLTRVVRDIPGGDIVTGNLTTNLRQVTEEEVRRQGGTMRDIRAREVRGARPAPEDLTIQALEYETEVSREVFFQAVVRTDTAGDDAHQPLAGFLRLSLPHPATAAAPLFDELEGSAIIREVHVYGAVVGFEDEGDAGAGAVQHSGLGRRLTELAAGRARAEGYGRLAVISAVGTRGYYRGLGFGDGGMYQVLETALRRPSGTQKD